MSTFLNSGRSAFLRGAQQFILGARLHYVLMPFADVLQKVYCLLRFVQWQKKFCSHTSVRNYTDRYEMYAGTIVEEKLEELCYLEFGVSKGDSIRWWLTRNTHPRSLFVGFDTFEGIPEAWGTLPRGSYTNHGKIPETTDTRCSFVKGIFQETLLPFLKNNAFDTRKVIHFDADLYSSTLFCLFAVSPYLKPNDLLIFDEFDMTTQEFRAFIDFQSALPTRFEVLAQSNAYKKIILKIH